MRNDRNWHYGVLFIILSVVPFLAFWGLYTHFTGVYCSDVEGFCNMTFAIGVGMAFILSILL